MATKAWTDDEVSQVIKRCIEEGRSFDQFVCERLPELFAEYQETSKTSGKTSIPEPEPTPDDDSNKTPKRRHAYWGTVEEDGE